MQVRLGRGVWSGFTLTTELQIPNPRASQQHVCIRAGVARQGGVSGLNPNPYTLNHKP